MDARAATLAVTRRFLSAYGPVTHHEFARWWGGCGVDAAWQWIAALGEEVSPIDVGGAQAWMLAADAREALELSAQRSVRLIPAFDQYVIGASGHAERLLPGDLRSRVYRPQGWISPVLLVNGFMQGVWRHKINGSRVEIVIEPFVKLPGWIRRAAAQEAECLSVFLGCNLHLGWKS
jgi:hypothetical protein